MIGLDRELNDVPTFLGALLLNELDKSIFELACENRLATFGAPDEMIDEQVYPVLIALVVHLAILIG